MQQLDYSLQPAESRHSDREERREYRWPGDRIPATNDAEVAHQNLDPELIRVFKQAMLADKDARERREFPSLEYANVFFSQPASLNVLPWPIAFFSSSVPPAQLVGLDNLIQTCYKRFLCKTPFLQDIPPLDFLRTPRPDYLTWALAALGASVLKGRKDQSLQLWWASANQLLGALEVDNSVARKTDLVKAWILLESFAFLSSDASLRRRARMLHGCVKTATWRILCDAPYFDRFGTDMPSPQDIKIYHSQLLMSYFLLIDLLRAIQHRQPTSFPTALFLCTKRSTSSCKPNTAEADVTKLVIDGSDDPLISLLLMLADIHLMTNTFSPLSTQTQRSDEMACSTAESIMHIPFTPGHEIRNLRKKLSISLQRWEQIHSKSAAKDLLMMYYFCRLYNLVPSLQSLYALADYARRSWSTFEITKKTMEATEALPSYRAAMSTVWLILEISELLPSEALPIWSAISVFSAALVIWAVKEFGKDGDAGQWTARSLHPFQQELIRMKSSGAQDMAHVLAKLAQDMLPSS